MNLIHVLALGTLLLWLARPLPTMSQRNTPDDDASEQALGIEILKVVMNYCNDGLKAE